VPLCLANGVFLLLRRKNRGCRVLTGISEEEASEDDGCRKAATSRFKGGGVHGSEAKRRRW